MTCMDLEIAILSEVKSDWEGQILYDITYMWNLKNGTNEPYLQSRNTVTDVENLWLPRREVGE